jgi:hypothetical protein
MGSRTPPDPHKAEVEEKLYLINSEGGMEELDMTETMYMLDFCMETQHPAAFHEELLVPRDLTWRGNMCDARSAKNCYT